MGVCGLEGSAGVTSIGDSSMKSCGKFGSRFYPQIAAFDTGLVSNSKGMVKTSCFGGSKPVEDLWIEGLFRTTANK